MSQNKKAYFQGGGGENEPAPKKKKYKSDPAIVVQPRFKEPFYHNYDAYNIPGFEHIGPGAGWHHMHEFKSVKDFLDEKRKKMKDKYKSDDSWQLDDGTRTKKNPNIKARAALFSRLIKADHMMAPKEHGTSIYDWKNSPYQGVPKAHKKHDSNDIDFPIDDQVTPIGRDSEGYLRPNNLGPEGKDISTFPSVTNLGDSESYPTSADIGGSGDEYLPLPDFEGKTGDQLDFGHDSEDGEFSKGKDIDLDKLTEKYLNPAEPPINGIPDGISPPEDLDAPNNENPQYGETDSGNTLYDKMWI
jgi:hypothetical protein